MFKYYFILSLLISNALLFSQTQTVANLPYIKKTAMLYSYPPDGFQYNFDATKDIGHLSVEQYVSKDWRSIYKVDISALPTGYPIKSVKIHAYITEKDLNSRCWLGFVPNNLDLNNATAIFNSNSADFTVFDYTDTISYNITSLITSQHLSDKYFIIKAQSYDVYNNSLAKISISVDLEFYIPMPITVDNNFTDNTGNGTNGKVNISDYAEDQTAPFQINKIAGDNVLLTAVSNQTNNQNHQMIWHEGSIKHSEWWKNGAYKGSLQTYTLNVAENDNNSTYQAQLRKNFKIDRVNRTEFDGNPTNTSWIVEQNSGQISTTGNGYAPGPIPYNFVYWTDNLSNATTRNITPTDNQTYTALYKYPHHSNTGSFSNSGQRKVIKCDYGYLHLVYESMGYVWYERSTDNGLTWHIMNGGKPIDKNPSKSPSIDFYYGYQRLIIVYQTWAGDNNEFAAIKAACFANGQLQFTSTIYESYLTIYSEENYKPVVGYASNDNIAVAWEDYGIWYVTGVLSFDSKQITLYSSGSVDNYNSANINPTIAAYKTTPGTATFHLAWQNNYSTIRYCNLTAQSDHTFLVSAVDQVSQGCGFPVNYY
ncbi:MAG TPA: hypothetical protein VF270_02680, partial [Ignavibacteriaceae bacterium]